MTGSYRVFDSDSRYVCVCVFVFVIVWVFHGFIGRVRE